MKPWMAYAALVMGFIGGVLFACAMTDTRFPDFWNSVCR